MSEMDQVAAPDYFELMIARFTPKPRADELRITTLGELDQCLAHCMTEPMLAIGLSCVAEDADWGHFLLLMNGERAWVHLMEGPCRTARDPGVNGSRSLVTFEDDGGVSHKIPFEDTISREQGLRALRHWLPRGEKLPELVWG